jgi:hypothetical protein
MEEKKDEEDTSWPICVDCGGHGIEEYDGQLLCGDCVGIRLELER